MTWFKTQGESDDAWALRRDLLIEELAELKEEDQAGGDATEENV